MHSFLVATGSLIIKARITHHDDFLYPCQVYSFEATNHKFNPAFKRNFIYKHYSGLLEKALCFQATTNCVDGDWLTYQPIT